MNPVEEIIGIIYGIHCERIRLKKIFETLPEDLQKKHRTTVADVDESMHEHGHCIAEIVLDLM